MKIYLARHGEPVSESIDARRPLSSRGRLDVGRVAGLLGKAGVSVSRVMHSGKLRAEETAEILADAVARGATLERVDGIAPNDDPTPLADDIVGWQEDTLIVGHLPFMRRLASLLITGTSQTAAVDFHAGSVACLERSIGGEWQLVWLLSPELMN